MEIKYFESLPYFNRKNLELVLGSNRRTLDARIKRLIDTNILLRIKKGFYLSIPYYKNSDNKRQLLEYIGSLLVSPSYISLEYALSSYNLLAESVYSVTYITTKETRSINTNLTNYVYKSIKRDLFFGFETRLFDNKEYQVASPAKALFDFFYFVKPVGKSITVLQKYVLEGSRINWGALSFKDKNELKAIVRRVKSPKMNTILKVLMKNNIL